MKINKRINNDSQIWINVFGFCFFICTWIYSDFIFLLYESLIRGIEGIERDISKEIRRERERVQKKEIEKEGECIKTGKCRARIRIYERQDNNQKAHTHNWWKEATFSQRSDFFAMMLCFFSSFRLVCWAKRPIENKKRKYKTLERLSYPPFSLYMFFFTSGFQFFSVENFHRHPALSFDQTTASVILLSFTTFVRDADEMVLEKQDGFLFFFARVWLAFAIPRLVSVSVSAWIGVWRLYRFSAGPFILFFSSLLFGFWIG